MLSMARFGTSDVARAKRFYDLIAKALGAERFLDRHGVVGYRGPSGGSFLIGRPIKGAASAGNGSQVGFIAPSIEAVDTAYRIALAHGAQCLGPPGPREPAHLGRYAAYFRDVDGNKVMLVHLAAVDQAIVVSDDGLATD